MLRPQGAYSEDLFFMVKGTVNAVTSPGRTGGRVLFPIYERGAFFGEQCLLGEASEVEFRAAQATNVLCVPKDALIEACALMDDEAREQFAEAVWDDILRKANLRLWGIRIMMAEVIEENNKKGNTKMMSDEFVTALVIQVWYLNSVNKRLRRKTAAEMLPNILLGDPDADADEEKEKKEADEKLREDVATLREKVDGLDAKFDLLLAKLDAQDKAYNRINLPASAKGTPPPSERSSGQASERSGRIGQRSARGAASITAAATSPSPEVPGRTTPSLDV